MGLLDKLKKENFTSVPFVEKVVDKELQRHSSTSVVQMAKVELPKLSYNKKTGYVMLGDDHGFGAFLESMMYKSAIHGAIVSGKTQMIAGKEILVNGAKTADESAQELSKLTPVDQQKYKEFVSNPNGTEDWYTIKKRLSLDLVNHGMVALEIIWSVDFSRIATVKYLDVSKVVASKMENDFVEYYYYCEDWKDQRNNKITELQNYLSTNTKEYSQIVFYKQGKLSYYGVPSWIGGIDWINVDVMMGCFHMNNISNGFAPSLVMKFYDPELMTPEKNRWMTDNIRKQYKGAENAGKALLFFNDGKDLAPDVTPLEMSNIDKQYIAISDTAVQRILSGHKVTSPELFGIAIPGKLGNSSIQDSYKIYDTTVIEPDRTWIEYIMNDLLRLNKIPVVVTFAEFNPFADDKTTTAVDPLLLQDLTKNERRALAGFDALTDDSANDQTLADKLGIGGTQTLVSIIADPVLTPEQKVNSLIVLYNLPEASAKLLIYGNTLPNTTTQNPTV